MNELYNQLMELAIIYAADSNRHNVFAQGYDKGASWAFEHAAKLVQSAQQGVALENQSSVDVEETEPN